MSSKSRDKAPPPNETEPDSSKERARHAREEAAEDEVLREQSKTETEQRPYLDTEGSD